MKRVVATGRTVDEAVTSALVRLGVTRSQATIRVIQEPVNRLFGFIRAKDAEVEVTAVLSQEETAREFLLDTLALMGVEAKIRVKAVTEEDDADHAFEITCGEDVLPVVIGRHGVTLDSLQYLANAVANRAHEKHIRVVVDAGDYRHRRKEGLRQMAERAVEKAVRTRKPVVLESMVASERKLIHTYLQGRLEVTTTSEGTEPNRKVVVVPVGASGTGRRTAHGREADKGRITGTRDAQ